MSRRLQNKRCLFDTLTTYKNKGVLRYTVLTDVKLELENWPEAVREELSLGLHVGLFNL